MSSLIVVSLTTVMYSGSICRWPLKKTRSEEFLPGKLASMKLWFRMQWMLSGLPCSSTMSPAGTVPGKEKEKTRLV